MEIRYEYGCKKCPEVLPNRKAFLDHHRAEHRKRFSCSYCLKGFVKARSLRAHVTKDHPEKKTGETADSSQSDEPENGEQSQDDDNDPFRDYVYKSPQPYSSPSYTEFDNSSPSTSQQQNLGVTQPSELDQLGTLALQSPHSTSSPSIAPPPRPPPSLPLPWGSHNPYHCPSCPKSFLTKRDLYSHLNAKHPAKRITCPKCEKFTFSKLSSFETHLEKKHSGNMDGKEVEKCRRLLQQNITRLEQEERFLCPHCRSEFKSSYFRVHLKKMHPELVNSSHLDEPEYGRRQFQGSQSSTFDNNPELTNHTVQPYSWPSYTGFDDSTASTSQQQMPSMPVPLGHEYPESADASQQNLDGNPPDGSSQPDCSSSQLKNRLKHFLDNPPQEDSSIAQELEANQPDPTFSQQQNRIKQFLDNSPEEDSSIAQELEANRPDPTVSQQQFPQSFEYDEALVTTDDYHGVTRENTGLDSFDYDTSNRNYHNSWTEHPSNVVDSYPSASTSQQQNLGMTQSSEPDQPDTLAPQSTHSTSSPSIAPPPRPHPSVPPPRVKEKPYLCPLCPMSFSSHRGLNFHRRNKHFVRCPKCQEKFIQSLIFENHLKKKHSGIMTEQEIEQEIQKCRGLLECSRPAPEKKLLCSHCRKVYKIMNSFQWHMKHKHNVRVTRETAASYYWSEPEHESEQFGAAQNVTSDNNTQSSNFTQFAYSPPSPENGEQNQDDDNIPSQDYAYASPQPYSSPSYTGFDNSSPSTSQQQNLDMSQPHGLYQPDYSASQLQYTASSVSNRRYHNSGPENPSNVVDSYSSASTSQQQSSWSVQSTSHQKSNAFDPPAGRRMIDEELDVWPNSIAQELEANQLDPTVSQQQFPQSFEYDEALVTTDDYHGVTRENTGLDTLDYDTSNRNYHNSWTEHPSNVVNSYPSSWSDEPGTSTGIVQSTSHQRSNVFYPYPGRRMIDEELDDNFDSPNQQYDNRPLEPSRYTESNYLPAYSSQQQNSWPNTPGTSSALQQHNLQFNAPGTSSGFPPSAPGTFSGQQQEYQESFPPSP